MLSINPSNLKLLAMEDSDWLLKQDKDAEIVGQLHRRKSHSPEEVLAQQTPGASWCVWA
jgi:hypothetical protein